MTADPHPIPESSSWQPSVNLPWVLDLDGVVWIGDQPIPGASGAISALQARTDVFFVTNMSALPVAAMEDKLARHGISAAGQVITSAMAAASLVDAGETVLVVGGDGISEAVEARGAASVPIADYETSRSVDAVVVGMEPAFDYGMLSRAMTAVRGGARLIGTNHDPSYPTPSGLKAGGGAIVAAIAYAAEVTPIFAGKPQAPAADLVRARLGSTGLMVGDRPDSDGLFAVELGYRFGLVLTGVTSDADLPVDPPADVVADSLVALVELAIG